MTFRGFGCSACPRRFVEPLPKSLKKSGGWQFGGQNTDSVEFTGLLRVRRERPCGRKTTEKRDEISSLHVCPRHASPTGAPQQTDAVPTASRVPPQAAFFRLAARARRAATLPRHYRYR